MLLARNRNFRLLFSATSVSNLGDGVSALAVPWLATLLTRDPLLIALVPFAGSLPWMLFAIPAGAVVDRSDRRALMVRADVLRVLLTMGIVALALRMPEGGGALPVMALAGLAFLLGSAEVVRDNAAQTFLPAVVEPGDLEAANGQLWSAEQVAGHFVGPPLAGLLIAWAVPAPFLLDAVTFALAAWLVWAISVPRRVAPTRRRLWEELGEGWRWLRGQALLFRLAVMLGLINFVHMASLTVLVLFSQEILGLSAAGHGVLLAVGAGGAVLGGVLGPRVSARFGATATVRLALCLMPLPFFMLGLGASPLLAGLALVLEAVAAMLWNIVTVSWRQRIIPDALLGRVNALYRFFGWGMMPLGALAGGALVALAEPGLGREMALRMPYVLGGAGMLALALYGIARLRF
ncbi:MFS transporter [Vannielia litorea]|uniref:MFS transporter n=1 Tax=Vannielia litorea TaxID=1217970 RepID=UPI001C953CF6|nr:MFS transporter [Vannielia litorea]MBY6048502.1 MFS transporter [Vannielia litorea]MBY6075916.1 MFS transporter [Vannielia litorea]